MTILIADQDKRFRTVVKRLLQMGGNVEVVWEASDGEEAVKLARELEPDLVLMEISLPKLNGLEATEMIKKAFPDAQVIILTPHANQEYRSAALRSGANAVFPKSASWTGVEVH